MSDTNRTAERDGQPESKPQGGSADAGEKHPVDVDTQEDAAKERAENGGYD